MRNCWVNKWSQLHISSIFIPTTNKLILVSLHISSIVITYNLVQLSEFKQELSNSLKGFISPISFNWFLFFSTNWKWCFSSNKKKKISLKCQFFFLSKLLVFSTVMLRKIYRWFSIKPQEKKHGKFRFQSSYNNLNIYFFCVTFNKIWI